MTLSVGDYVLLVAILSLPTGLIAIYLRAIRAEAIRFQVVVQKRLDEHERRLQVVEQHKVGHADWVRVTTSQQHSLDITRELVRELGGKLDASIGISGSLKRVADALRDQTGRGK